MTTQQPRPEPSLKPSHSNGDSRAARFFRLPLVWMAIGVIGVGMVSSLTAAAGEPGTAGGVIFSLVAAAVAFLIYQLVMQYVAQRTTPEIGGRRAGLEALSGAAIGVGFVLVSVLVIAVFGGYSFARSSHDVMPVLVSMAALAVAAAVPEELIFRGLALQGLERVCGSWPALAITALFFGAAHLFNPGATVWGAIAIALEAGVLLGAAFLWRRNIWFVAGLHFAWNTTSGLFGIPASGHVTPGILITEVSGPDLLTGGAFGLEASIVPVLVSVLISVPMIVLARRRGGLVPIRPSRRPNLSSRSGPEH